MGLAPRDKIRRGAAEALDGFLFDGMTIMAGGFGGCGIADLCIQEIRRRGVRDLTIISNNCGGEFADRPGEGFGLWTLLKDGLVARAVASYIGTNRTFERQHLDGTIELELTPQGTLAERIRAGGAGIPAFYTPAAVGTPLAEGKEVREFDGRPYLLERWLKADFALVRCEVADRMGNLTYNKTARNFSPLMCMAAKTTIVQARRVVEPGEIDPEHVVTPGIFVDRVVEVAEPAIESRLIAEGRRFP